METMKPIPAAVIREALSPMAPIPTSIHPQFAETGPIRAVLFDIYGTLLISGTGDISLASHNDEATGIAAILDGVGTPLLLEDAADDIPGIMDRLIRRRHDELKAEGIDYPEVEIRDIWRDVLNELWDRGYLESDPEDASVQDIALRHELAVNPVWPMPGFPDIITVLKESGCSIGIVSNAQFYTPLILEAVTDASLSEMGFEKELCAWSWEMRRAKPSPEVFTGPLRSLDARGISPRETLYVGNDMLNDVTAASHAGCRTALFAGDQRSLRLREGDPRVDGKPDMIITELTQLKALI